MKHCKSCKKEIDSDATKCPYCQAYQVWYKNPQTYGVVFPLAFMILLFYMMGIFGSPDFEDYKEKIKTEKQSEAMVGNYYFVNFKITNETDLTWNQISYNLISYDKDDAVLVSESGHEFRWHLPANESVILSARSEDDPKIVRRELIITSLKKDRF